MKKRWWIGLLALLLCITAMIPGLAEGTIPAERQKPLFVDDANLLSEDEALELDALLEKISAEQGCEVAIVTVDSLEEKSAKAYADDYYDYNGYGYGEGDDGILLLISMQSRDWALSTYGYAVTVFGDWAQWEIMNGVLPFLSNGEYATAFTGFAYACESFLKAYQEGGTESYEDVVVPPRGPEVFSSKRLFGAALVGVLAAFITVNAMKKKLKSVRSKAAASDYVVENSLDITRSTDLYLYSHVNRVKKAQTQNHSGSSVHTSSSGRIHGGSHGKF